MMRIEAILLVSAAVLIVVVGIRLWRPYASPKGHDIPSLGLDTLIESLRHELERVDHERMENGKAPLFKIGTTEIEVSFVVKQGTKLDGKAELSVVTVGGSEEVSQEQVQKIKLTLVPIPPRTGHAAPQ
jgi:hypothetical protein